jgi:hypothetical protein
LQAKKTKIGGFALNTLKKLKGDKFPSASTVLANAMGLGPTGKYPCNFVVVMLLVNTHILFFLRCPYKSK